MVTESKKWYQSKTMWSQIVIIGIGVLNVLGQVGVIPLEVCNKITGEVMIIGGALGIYGRKTAKSNIK